MLTLAAIAIDMLVRPAKRIRGSGSYVDGRWVSGTNKTIDILAVIQPITSADLQKLEEGERAEASVSIWSRTEMRTAEVNGQLPADVIRDELGKEWKIIRVFDRREGGYYKAIGGRL